MSAPGKNARKKAKRRAVVPQFSTEPEDLNPYAEPQRCRNCGDWILMICMVGTKACCLNCEQRLKEKQGGGTA